MAPPVWIFLPFRLAGFFGRPDFDRPAFRDEQRRRRLWFVKDTRGVFPVLRPVVLMNPSKMAGFSFRPAFL
jgi:hypothetical protein